MIILVQLLTGAAGGVALLLLAQILWPKKREIYTVCDPGTDRAVAAFTSEREALICAGASAIENPRYPHEVVPIPLDPDEIAFRGNTSVKYRGAARKEIRQADRERAAAHQARLAGRSMPATPAAYKAPEHAEPMQFTEYGLALFSDNADASSSIDGTAAISAHTPVSCDTPSTSCDVSPSTDSFCVEVGGGCDFGGGSFGGDP